MATGHSARPSLARDQFERIAKALADPRRVAVLEAIARGDTCGCPQGGESGTGDGLRRLCEWFPVSKATISHHVKELKQAGLIDTHRDGQRLHCTVRHDVLEVYTAELLRRIGSRPSYPAPSKARREHER